MGIVSQLPSSHLSIHRVPAKLSNGVLPHGEYHCWLRLLFALELLLTWHPFGSTVKFVDAMPPLSCLASCYGCRKPRAIVYRFLLQNPAQLPFLKRPFGRALEEWILYPELLYAACSVTCPGCLMSFCIFTGSYFWPVLRIVKITRRSLQAITISDCIFLSGLSVLVV